MNFGTAKSTSMGILLAALAIGVSSLFLFGEGSAGYIGSAVLLVALFAAGIAIMVIWGRCPYCGKRLFYGLYKWKICPKCRRKLCAGDKYTPAVNKNKHR